MFNCLSLPHHVSFSSQKNITPSLPSCVGGRNIRLRQFKTCVPDLGTSIFSSHSQLTHSFTWDRLTHNRLSHTEVNSHIYLFSFLFFFFSLLFLRNQPLAFLIIYLITLHLHTSIVIVSTQLNGFIYCYLTLVTQFNMNYLFAHSEMVPSIAMYH